MATDNPTPKLCECGCNRPAPIATYTKTKFGIVKGQPLRFVNGHPTRGRRRKLVTSTYVAIQRDGRYETIHRLRAETALGHALPPKAVVHHPDEDRWNPNARLILCDSQGFHLFLHRLMRIKKAGGHPFRDDICAGCHCVKPLEEFSIERRRVSGHCAYCRACSSLRQKTQRRATVDTPPK